ncbi:MAG: hypothetical protein HUU14_07695 [Dehalococcoidia bacterium]|nr:hypothetical protein [Chloroflexi bacterium CFX7]MCL4230471.1 hypothetical protein [Dehalococcoidia bacterium]NUQ55752.1 hypothetical protein [Dehalococcoidia bacterium]
MRVGAYHLFELVAWPALAWCALELPLRAASGAAAGTMVTAVTLGCAVATVVACRWRKRALAVGAHLS